MLPAAPPAGPLVPHRAGAHVLCVTTWPEPTLDEKVRYLATPDSYAERPSRVELIRTHMACVFLTDRYAYKLKKPIRTPYVDHVGLDARLHACREEVRLNRRLAPDVYLGVVALTVDTSGCLRLGGEGTPVDWLVHMVRLAADSMLDVQLRAGTVDRRALGALGGLLARFYRGAPRAEWSPSEYAASLECDVMRSREELGRRRYGLSRARVDEITAAQLAFARAERGRFEARAAQGYVVEAHGDLRPEHISLGPEPVIIDCLEFSRELRLLDAASELAFLMLECDRLGGGWAGRAIFEAYARERGDDPPADLVAFYEGQHALVRAKLAAFHLDDPSVGDPPRWIERARSYLELAARHAGGGHFDGREATAGP